MKKIHVLIAIVSIFSSSLRGQPKGQPQNSDSSILVGIVSKIDGYYKEAIKNIDSTIEISSAEITFNISTSNNYGAGLNVWVLKLGKKRETKKYSTVTFSLSREANEIMMIRTKIKPTNDIGQLIFRSANDFKKMNDAGYLSQLDKREFTVEAGLIINNSGSGEVAIEVVGISAELGRSKEQGHSIKLSFKKK